MLGSFFPIHCAIKYGLVEAGSQMGTTSAYSTVTLFQIVLWPRLGFVYQRLGFSHYTSKTANCIDNNDQCAPEYVKLIYLVLTMVDSSWRFVSCQCPCKLVRDNFKMVVDTSLS